MFAYNPATKRYTKKHRKIDKTGLVDLVAGKTVKEIEKRKRRVNEDTEAVERYLIQIRQMKQQLRQSEKDYNAYKDKTDVDKLKAEALEKIEKSELLDEKLIDDIRIVADEVFVTTSNLIITADGPLSSSKHRFKKGDEIGRFLIWIRPFRTPSAENIKICNLTWRLGNEEHGFYHHPYISRGGALCTGGFGTDMAKHLKAMDIMAVIDDCINLLVSHKDHHYGPNWEEYFKLRRPLEEKLEDGNPYWYFNDGPFSLERWFADKQRQDIYNSCLKRRLKEFDIEKYSAAGVTLRDIHERIFRSAYNDMQQKENELALKKKMAELKNAEIKIKPPDRPNWRPDNAGYIRGTATTAGTLKEI